MSVQDFYYVSSVEGRLVTRYVSLRQPSPQYIGATRQGRVVTFNTEAVIALPAIEWKRHRREYRKLIRDKSLLERTKGDFDAWQVKRAAEDAAAGSKSQAEEKPKPLSISPKAKPKKRFGKVAKE